VKKQLFIFSLLMLVMVNILGGCKMADKKNVTTKEEQIEFLKKHESQITEYVKNKSNAIEEIQYDWDSVSISDSGAFTKKGFNIRVITYNKYKEKINGYSFFIIPKPDVDKPERIDSIIGLNFP